MRHIIFSLNEYVMLCYVMLVYYTGGRGLSSYNPQSRLFSLFQSTYGPQVVVKSRFTTPEVEIWRHSKEYLIGDGTISKIMKYFSDGSI